MTSKLPNFIKNYGLLNGLKLYSHFKFKSVSPIRFSFVKHPVYIRNIKSDMIMLEQIFVNKEYDIRISFAPKVIIDLGANVGYASIFFANRFPDAKIVALEPEDDNYSIAKKNTESYNHITLIKGAVWNKSGQVNVLDSGHGEAAYVTRQDEGDHPVKACTVKEIMQLTKASYIDILKIDIEGAEKEIFETGFEDWIPFTKLIIVETHDRYRPGTSKAVFSTIAKYDFSLELKGENLILYNNSLVKAY